MNALVTGGVGFVGRHLVERLLADGHQVTCLDLPSPELNQINSIGAEAAGCNLCDLESIDRHFKGKDAVFHVAAFASPWRKREKFSGALVWLMKFMVTESGLNCLHDRWLQAIKKG